MKTTKQPPRFQIQYIADAINRTRAMREQGITPSKFYRYARKYGIPYTRAGSSYVLDSDDDRNIQELLDSGMSQRDVASKFGVSRRAIQNRRYRARSGVPCRGAKNEP